MSDFAIRAQRLGKRYRLGQRQIYQTMRERIASMPARLFSGRRAVPQPRAEVWAVRDVSFQVERGEVVGVIGGNGAGKSTLLKILSRITEPTEGWAEIRGRVASLLEVGSGFHPELTGGENIYLNGAILGMRKSEIRRKFEEIVAFAEIDKFIDTAVKHYSSGMYLRLAFAVAAYLEPEVLIIDEVLAVGDAGFQDKCLGKVRDVARSGRTVLFVSHNMAAVRSLTERALWMDAGAIRSDGPTASVIHDYLAAFEKRAEPGCPDITLYRRDRYARSPVRIQRFWVNQSPGAIPTLDMGRPFVLTVEIETEVEIRGGHVSLELKTTEGTRVTLMLSLDAGFQVFTGKGRHLITCEVNELILPPGHYLGDVGITGSATARSWDVILNYPLFTVEDRSNQVLDWPDRPWAAVHCRDLSWNVTTGETSAAYATVGQFERA